MNVLNNKKCRAKKRDKNNATTSADEKGSGAALAHPSDASDGTEEAELELVADESGAQGVLHAADVHAEAQET